MGYPTWQRATGDCGQERERTGGSVLETLDIETRMGLRRAPTSTPVSLPFQGPLQPAPWWQVDPTSGGRGEGEPLPPPPAPRATPRGTSRLTAPSTYKAACTEHSMGCITVTGVPTLLTWKPEPCSRLHSRPDAGLTGGWAPSPGPRRPGPSWDSNSAPSQALREGVITRSGPGPHLHGLAVWLGAHRQREGPALRRQAPIRELYLAIRTRKSGAPTILPYYPSE